MTSEKKPYTQEAEGKETHRHWPDLFVTHYNKGKEA
jgi:hypothetical protein